MQGYLILLLILQISIIICQQPYQCNHTIYCEGIVRDTIQSYIKQYNIFSDQKTYVDMPLKLKPEIIQYNFNLIQINYTNQTIPEQVIQDFLNDNFYPAGSELEVVSPVDWTANPEFLSKIADPNLKNMAQGVNNLWNLLLRNFNHNNTQCGDQCYSSIKLNYPFIIAGQRFREYYYWDSFWIIKGLLTCDMYETAVQMVLNFGQMLEDYGFVLNGGRIYYSSRSQPPLLTQMVQEIYNYFIQKNMSSEATKLLQNMTNSLFKEYSFWNSYRNVSIEVDNVSYNLNHYHSAQFSPRPESYMIDVELANQYIEKNQQSSFFQNLTSSCETGWDFSSRWFKNKDEIQTVNTPNIIPTDLNMILYLNEISLSNFANLMNNTANQTFFQNQAANRKTAIFKVLYKNATNQFYDFNLSSNKQNDQSYYISNFEPLFAFSQDLDEDSLNKMVQEIHLINNQFAGGIPTSLYLSGQQWDFPNIWAPTTWFAITGLFKSNNQNAVQLAYKITEKFLFNMFCAYYNYPDNTTNQGGTMFEKYNAVKIGNPGGGGEYTVQTGFGWTNGVFLDLLSQYGQNFSFNYLDCPLNSIIKN